MRKLSAIGIAMALVGCSPSPDLGFDPSTRTYATKIGLDHKAGGVKITCERETEQCIRRAEAICAGGYKIIGRPSVSPRVQALVDLKITTINTDRPNEILIICDR